MILFLRWIVNQNRNNNNCRTLISSSDQQRQLACRNNWTCVGLAEARHWFASASCASQFSNYYGNFLLIKRNKWVEASASMHVSVLCWKMIRIHCVNEWRSSMISERTKRNEENERTSPTRSISILSQRKNIKVIDTDENESLNHNTCQSKNRWKKNKHSFEHFVNHRLPLFIYLEFLHLFLLF